MGEVQCAIVPNLAQGRYVVRQDGAAAQRGLERSKAEGPVDGGADVQRALAKERQQFALLQLAKEQRRVQAWRCSMHRGQRTGGDDRHRRTDVGQHGNVLRLVPEPATPPVRLIAQLKSRAWDLHCDACRGVLRPLPTDETKPSEINSMYALSKRDQEELCLIYGRTCGLPVTALRSFNIYGTRQALSNPYTGVAAIFASRMLNDQAPLVFEDGEQMRDFVSVRDIARANMLAMERPESDGEVINIGCGQPISIRSVAEVIARCLGNDLEPAIMHRYRAGDIRHCYADLTKARALLGYEPQVGYEEGFRELAAWLRGRTAEDKADTMLRELSAYGLTA